jgi:hypothetical protein
MEGKARRIRERTAASRRRDGVQDIKGKRYPAKKKELMFHYQDNGSDCCQKKKKKKDNGSDKHQNETSVRVHQHPRIQGPYMATYARQNR